MKKFFETQDGQLLEIDSPLNLDKANIKEYDVHTSDDLSATYLPVVEKTENGYVVRVNQPVKEQLEHSLDSCCKNKVVFIELDVDDLSLKRFISLHEKPEVVFHVPHGKHVVAYAYNSQGGLWSFTYKDDEEQPK